MSDMIRMLLLLVGFAVIGFGIIELEYQYYKRHPEKTRPDASMYP